MQFLSGGKVLVLEEREPEEVKYLGHTTDMDGYCTAPSIMLFAKEEWAEGNGNVSWSYERANREGISVL